MMIEKIYMILLSCFALAGIVFLEFYCIEKELFEYLPHIGIAFHFFGGFFVSIMVYYVCMNSLLKLEWYIIVIFLMGSVALAAVGWEGFEWGLGRLTGSPYQVSLDNTMGDLFVGLAGGITACTIAIVRNVLISRTLSVNIQPQDLQTQRRMSA